MWIFIHGEKYDMIIVSVFDWFVFSSLNLGNLYELHIDVDISNEK